NKKIYIVHNDAKNDNIMFDKNNTPVVIDFEWSLAIKNNLIDFHPNVWNISTMILHKHSIPIWFTFFLIKIGHNNITPDHVGFFLVMKDIFSIQLSYLFDEEFINLIMDPKKIKILHRIYLDIMLLNIDPAFNSLVNKLKFTPHEAEKLIIIMLNSIAHIANETNNKKIIDFELCCDIIKKITSTFSLTKEIGNKSCIPDSKVFRNKLCSECIELLVRCFDEVINGNNSNLDGIIEHVNTITSFILADTYYIWHTNGGRCRTLNDLLSSKFNNKDREKRLLKNLIFSIDCPPVETLVKNILKHVEKIIDNFILRLARSQPEIYHSQNLQPRLPQLVQ
ncbi:MAG: hypothetical protein KDH96_10515, partial [Candidatus Riesia sp.]|nr:hypothetical protein [Candidatus Riesia sp.]